MPDPAKTNSVNEVKTLATEANNEAQQTLTLRQTFSSALAAMIGVQSKEKRERDFARGKASHFIIVGVVLTATFVLVMAGVVTLVLRVAL